MTFILFLSCGMYVCIYIYIYIYVYIYICVCVYYRIYLIHPFLFFYFILHI